jgi:hypothetical protein
MTTKSNQKAVKKPRFEPVLKLPALPYEQFIALRDNIAVHGVLVPILVDSGGPLRKNGVLLDPPGWITAHRRSLASTKRRST